MCGINGFSWNDEILLRKMNHLARFRGPDGSGVFVDDAVSLGSTRLAIIDLSERGNQPMSNHDQTVWIVFNGEIYNYKQIKEKLMAKGRTFKSDGDTEVIIQAYEEYGVECFDMLNGMWGMAIYDKKKNSLILCRDRFGVKPLYFSLQNGQLVFSSMLAAFAEHDIAIGPNHQAIMDYLAFNLTQHNEQTFFDKIYSLLPGHFLNFDLTNCQAEIKAWYVAKPHPVKDEIELRKVFGDAVRWRTVSDVPVGVCLSGGVDSSAITCILDKALPSEFNAFSLVAPGSPVNEQIYINEVVEFTGAQPYSTTVDPKTFLDDVVDFVAAMEEPATGLSAYAQYRVFKLAHKHGAKVLLDGQGGDELFGGYLYYWGYFFYELFQKGRWGLLLKNLVLSAFKIKKLFPYQLFFFLLLPARVQNWLWKNTIVTWVDHEYLNQVSPETKDPRWQPLPLRELLNLTLFSTSVPHNLIWGDKSSMRWSVECREPFMDYRLVEAALAMPTDQLLVDGETKVIFRKAIKNDIPELIYERKDKIGFQAPEDTFFRDPEVMKFAEGLIYSESFKNRPYWNWKVVDQIFQAHKMGKRFAGDLMWKWINTELWLREFFEANPAPIRQSLSSS